MQAAAYLHNTMYGRRWPQTHITQLRKTQAAAHLQNTACLVSLGGKRTRLWFGLPKYSREIISKCTCLQEASSDLPPPFPPCFSPALRARGAATHVSIRWSNMSSCSPWRGSSRGVRLLVVTTTQPAAVSPSSSALRLTAAKGSGTCEECGRVCVCVSRSSSALRLTAAKGSGTCEECGRVCVWKPLQQRLEAHGCKGVGHLRRVRQGVCAEAAPAAP
eukprot:244685-Chlamydomonas_euryale.AAC.4